MPILEAQFITKSFRRRTVVKDISFKIKRGEIIGLLGPNGAGKTTAFYMVVGLIRQDRGKILLDGKDISQNPVHLRAKKGIGYLPQESSIFKTLSVADNIMSILELQDLTLESRKDKLESLLQEFNIIHLRDNLGISLSGGERRRTEIARALAASPNFILLDEPFAGVDPISIIDIKRIINHLKDKNIGILITDHNVRDTLDICNRAYILNEGEILVEGDSKSILKNQEVRNVYLGEHFKL